MFDLERDLKELRYEIVWRQDLEYNSLPGGKITIIGALNQASGIKTSLWFGVVKFAGTNVTGGSNGGFLDQFTGDSQEEVKERLLDIFKSASLRPVDIR